MLYLLIFFALISLLTGNLDIKLDETQVHENCLKQCRGDAQGFHSRASIKFVMYYTDLIHGYSDIAYRINRCYGSFYNIEIILIDPKNDPQFEQEENDVRWNKVKILLNLLHDVEEDSTQYLIWLDSDLIFVDWNFNISQFLQQHPQFDLIVSKEINPANGIANTGSLVVRKSLWSRDFFRRWWFDYDHNAAMDQHAFGDLIRKYPATEMSHHLYLCSETTLNSQFPGLWTHRDEFPILHLAGESNFIRKTVFELAWKNLCQSCLSSSIPELWSYHCLLITRQELDAIDYLAIHAEEWNSIAQEIDLLSSDRDRIAIKSLHQVILSLLFYAYD